MSGMNIPKQLIKIAGKPIIEHTIATMQASPLIDEIVVMMAPGYLDEVRAIVKNGALRQGQLRSSKVRGPGALATTPRPWPWPRWVRTTATCSLHDAVRPLVSQTIIAANVEALADLRRGRHRHSLGRHGDPGR